MSERLVRPGELPEATRAQMYDLQCSQFENVSREQFDADMAEKNWVLLLHNDEGRLVGFSNMHVYKTSTSDQDLWLVYSGDTTVDSSTWNDPMLAYHLMGAFSWFRRHYGCDHLYWFLIVSGYRTYRVLPVFSENFYPRFDKPTPEDAQELMHAIAVERFNERYDRDSGIVRLDAPSILRDGYRGIPENRLSDPNIAFFAERNPGHLQGDALVCLCELSDEKLTKLGKRMWRKGQKLFADDE